MAIVVAIVLFIFQPWESTPSGETYTLTIHASPSGACWACPSGGEYESGRQLEISVAPAAGYVFDYWSGDASGATPTITITMDSNKSLTANFRPVTQTYDLTIDITPSGAGSVSPSGGEYPSGVQVILTANPASGYTFDHWSGDTSGATSSITITIDSDKSLTANFKVTTITYALAIEISPSGAGSVTITGGEYESGVQATLTASPATGYQFVNWTGDVGTIADVSDASTTITMNGDYSITANFCQIPLTYYTLTIAIAGSGSTSPAVGQRSYAAGSVVPIVATPVNGYRFVNWTGNLDTVGNVTAASTTITMNKPYSITANFVAVHYLTISSTIGGNVTTPGEGTSTYDKGAVVNLVATPDSGYRFVNWNGDAGTISNVNSATTTITMNDSYSVTANFALVYNLTMAVAPSDSGTATDLTNASPYTAGTIVNIQSVAAAGYRFVNWTASAGTFGNATAAVTNFTMPAQNVSVTADFVRQYNLNISSSTGGDVTTPGVGSHVYDQGAVVNLVATPDACYHFLSWTGDVATIANVTTASTTITMSGAYSIRADFEQEEAVYFPDANLEAAVREAIGKPTGPICPSDLLGLTSLGAYSRNIIDLTGLEYCTDLTVLDLHGNQITDIGCLANLTNLTDLELGDNGISDISPLVQNEGLAAGDYIDLRGNPLSSDSINTHIPQLQARGVTVVY